MQIIKGWIKGSIPLTLVIETRITVKVKIHGRNKKMLTGGHGVMRSGLEASRFIGVVEAIYKLQNQH